MRRTPILLLVAAVMGCTAPEAPATEKAYLGELGAEERRADEAAIVSLIGTYVSAYNAGDLESIVGLFTIHAIRMPPERPAYSGHPRIRHELARELAELGEEELSLTVEEIEHYDDFGYARGTYATTGEDEPVGKWLSLLDREADGPWRISTQIWNLDRQVGETPVAGSR